MIKRCNIFSQVFLIALTCPINLFVLFERFEYFLRVPLRVVRMQMELIVGVIRRSPLPHPVLLMSSPSCEAIGAVSATPVESAAAVTSDAGTTSGAIAAAAEMDVNNNESTPATAVSPVVPPRLSLPGISQSCLRLAALRCEESRHPTPHRLVTDPLAETLARGVRVERAPFICRKRKKETNTKQGEEKTEAGAPSASSSSMAAELADFNASRASAPDTMIRCRYIDDSIEEYVTHHSIRQLVLLGAGLDTRAYRLECLKSVDVFELDVPPVLEYKTILLDQTNRTNESNQIVSDTKRISRTITRVPVDLGEMGDHPNVSKKSYAKKKAKLRHQPSSSSSSADTTHHTPASASSSASAPSSSLTPPPWLSALLSTSFDPSLPTLWVAEGLLMYLGVHQVTNLLGWMARIATTNGKDGEATTSPRAASHHLIGDIMNDNIVRSKLRWYRFFRWGASRTGTHPSSIEPFLRSCGWCISTQSDGISPHIHPIGRDGLSYGRYLDPPLIDATSHPNKPPMVLESYMIRAQLLNLNDCNDATE